MGWTQATDILKSVDNFLPDFMDKRETKYPADELTLPLLHSYKSFARGAAPIDPPEVMPARSFAQE